MTVSVSLGEVCQFVGGGTPSRKIKEYWNGDIPWATVKDFQSDCIFKTLEFLSREGLQNSASKVIPSGTVLLVTRVGLGKVAMAGLDIAINQDIKAVIPSKDILPEFLLWSLKHLGPKIEAKGTGATVKGVTLRDIKEMRVLLPSLDEQRRIVGILNRAVKIERLRAQAAERLREFIPALFIKMFGDPVENPMGWEVQPLAVLISEFRYGTSRKCYDSAGSANDIPVLRIPNILRGQVDWTDLKFTSLRGNELTKLNLECGDILFVRTNGNPEYIGRCAIFRDRRQAAYASYLIRARLKSDGGAEPEYISNGLALPTMRQTLLQMARTTAGNYNISIDCLGRIRIPVPDLMLQRRFSAIIAQAHGAATAAKDPLGRSKALNASLMSSLLEAGA